MINTITYPTETFSNNEYLYSSDLGCCAALVSVGFELIALDKSNPRKVQFIFHRTEELEQAVSDYWADRLATNARTLFDNVKMIKNRIYTE